MKTCCIIAGGPSLIRDDIALVERAAVPIIGINCAYQIARCHILYACDAKFWDRHHAKIENCVKMSLEKTPFRDVLQIENGGNYGISDRFPAVKTGNNSGYQAINLAYLLGCDRILLLGYDMKCTGGHVHWHGLHEHLNNPDDNRLSSWLKNFDEMAPLLIDRGVKVINCTRSTALTCFDRVGLVEALNESK